MPARQFLEGIRQLRILLKTLDPVSEYGMTEKKGRYCEKDSGSVVYEYIIIIL